MEMDECLRFQKGNTSGIPLEYPLTEIPSDDGTSRIVSPCIGKSHGLEPAPYSGTPEFIDNMNEVARVRHDVTQGIWPSWFLENYGIDPKIAPPLAPHVEPTRENNFTSPAELAAELVHMDQPIDLGRIVLMWLLDNGAEWKCDKTEQHNPFLKKQPLFYADLGANVLAALEASFETKYFFGDPRPEEYFEFNISAYPEGSPCHPSGRTAGHGAAAGASYQTLIHHLELTEDLRQVTETACVQFASFRTFSGVHIMIENLDGFELGKRIVSESQSN